MAASESTEYLIVLSGAAIFISTSSERDKYYPLLSQYIVYTNAGEQVDLAGLLTGFERNGAEYLFTDPDAASLPGGQRKCEHIGRCRLGDSRDIQCGLPVYIGSRGDGNDEISSGGEVISWKRQPVRPWKITKIEPFTLVH